MEIPCSSGHWHDLTPTAMAVVIQAFQDGDMQTIGKGGNLTPLCLLDAFSDKERVKNAMRQHKNSTIVVDGVAITDYNNTSVSAPSTP